MLGSALASSAVAASHCLPAAALLPLALCSAALLLCKQLCGQGCPLHLKQGNEITGVRVTRTVL